MPLLKAMANQLKTALKMATAMLSIIAFTPSAYGATFKSKSTTWSTDDLSIFSEDYELVQVEPQSEDQELELNLELLSDTETTVSYFQNLVNTARQLKVSGTRPSEGTNVPLLPQVGYSRIFEGVYDFEINRPSNQSRRRVVVGAPSRGARARRPRLFKPRSGVARRQPALDFFSFRLSQFGGAYIKNEFVNMPRSEFLLSVNNYYGDITAITPITNSFGALKISVNMPTLPRQSIGGQTYQKYFNSSEADSESQRQMQRQVRKQMKRQEEKLKKWNKALGSY